MRARTLLVGLGGYGENYVREFLERDPYNAVLSAAIDPYIDRSAYKDELVKRGIPLYRSLDEFFSGYRGSIDLAVVSSPIHTHYGYISAFLERDINVLTEKPVVIDLDKMDALIEKEEKSNAFVSVGYQLCYQSDIEKIKEDILSGLYGRPVRAKALRLMRRDTKYYRRSPWAGKLSFGGERIFDSPLSNACAHHMEAMLYLLSPYQDDTIKAHSVEGSLYKGRVDIENFDAAAIKVRCEDGIDLYYYTAHSVESKKTGPLMELDFEGGRIVGEDDRYTGYLNDGSVIEYSAIDRGDRLKKLYDSADAALGHTRPHIGLKASKEHIRVVLLTEDLPVYLSYDAQKRGEGDEEYYAIPNLEREFLSSYEAWSIPKAIKEGVALSSNREN